MIAFYPEDKLAPLCNVPQTLTCQAALSTPWQEHCCPVRLPVVRPGLNESYSLSTSTDVSVCRGHSLFPAHSVEGLTAQCLATLNALDAGMVKHDCTPMAGRPGTTACPVKTA